MALTKSFPTGDPGGLSIDDTRRIFAGLVAVAADGSPRLGVVPAHLNPLVTSTGSMAYSVAPFTAVTSRSGTGVVELVANDAATTVPTTAAPASNSRIDVIWVRCLFTGYTDPTGLPVFGVTQGTAGVSPSKPTIPAGALELATATIPSTAIGTNSAGVVITQTYLYTAAAGGVVRVRNSTELAAWVPADGAFAARLDTGSLMARAAGAWRPLFPRISLVAGATMVVAGPANVNNWSTVGTGDSTADAGFAYNAASGDITCQRAGWYSSEVRMGVSAVSGAAIAFHMVRNGSGADVRTQDTVLTHGSFGTVAKLAIGSMYLNANDTLRLYVAATSTTLTIGGAGRANGEFLITYLGA